MNDIEKRIEEIMNIRDEKPHENCDCTSGLEATVRHAGFIKEKFVARLTTLYHQLLLEDRKRLIGVVEGLPHGSVGQEDGDFIERQNLLATLNKEKD